MTELEYAGSKLFFSMYAQQSVFSHLLVTILKLQEKQERNVLCFGRECNDALSRIICRNKDFTGLKLRGE